MCVSVCLSAPCGLVCVRELVGHLTYCYCCFLFVSNSVGSRPVLPAEEDALELLFRGDTNRAVAETPMNLASSRSHCIFTISMEVRDPSSDKIRRSKLHLVDLAGSERVAKVSRC